MDVTKKMLKNIPEHLLYFTASNLITLLIALAVNLMLRPLLTELARGDQNKEKVIDSLLWGCFALLFFVVLALLLSKSNGMKNRYLAETLGREYRFGQDLSEFLRSGYLTGIAAYFLFALPFTAVMAFFPELPILPMFFYPQYALIELIGNAVIAWIAGGAAYALFSIVFFPILHAIWEKNRIYRG